MDFARIAITTLGGTVDGIDPTPRVRSEGMIQCLMIHWRNTSGELSYIV